MLFYLSLTILVLNPYFSLGFTGDEIKQLPGLSVQPKFKQYSGYLNASKGNYLHYWFVESQSKPSEDPVILWLNGGPGCSSLGGFWSENGPFRVDRNDKSFTLREDPNSWNTLGNVLYLESPIGVGFSYTDSKTLNNSDDSTAEDNYLALQSFYQKFPQFSKNSFYITGESYAGTYIPMLALKIKRNKNNINLKGLAIGNGALDDRMFMTSRVRMAYTHSLIDSNQWNQLVTNCCSCSNTSGQICDFSNMSPIQSCRVSQLIRSHVLANGINPYNILSDCSPLDLYSTDSQLKESKLYLDLNKYFGIELNELQDLAQYYSSKPQCLSNAYQSYLNTVEVQKALHIPGPQKIWTQCKQVRYREQYSSMRSEVKELVEKHKISSFIVYNGDIDIVCDFLGDQEFVDSLGLKLIEKYKKWTVGKRTAGFVKRYEGLSFITVRGAGHMVPTDQPEAALKLIKELIGVSKVDS